MALAEKEKFSYQFNNSIKVFFSLYKFQKELSDEKVNTTNKKLYLINNNWFNQYKKFYLCDKIFKAIKENNLSDFDLIEQRIIFNNFFNEFYESNKNKNLLLFYDEEFPNIIKNIDNIHDKFINYFEIINQEIYENLLNCMGIFKYCKNNGKFHEYKIQDDNIIIKYIDDKNNCFNLLIGKLSHKTDIYIPDILVTYPNKDELIREYEDLSDKNNNIIKEYKEGSFDTTTQLINADKLSEKVYDNDVKFLSKISNNYPTFISSNGNSFLTEGRIKKDSLIKFLIYYYLNNEVLCGNNINDNKNEKPDNNSFCFLINKNWISELKSFCEYQNIKNQIQFILHNNDDFKPHLNAYGYNGILKNKNMIDNLVKLIIENNNHLIQLLQNKNEKDLINDLSDINPFLIDYDYHDIPSSDSNKYLKIYKNFEIIDFPIDKLIRIIFPKYRKTLKKYKYYINQENYLFLYSEYGSDNILSIFKMNTMNEIDFNIEMIISLNEIKNDRIIKFIKNNSIQDFISPLDFDEKNFIADINNSEGKVYLLSKGELLNNIKMKIKLKNFLFNFIKYNPYSDENYKKEKIIYLIHKDFFIKFLDKYGLEYTSFKKKFLVNKEKKEKSEKILLDELKEYLNKNYKYSFNDNDLRNTSLGFRPDPTSNKTNYIKIKGNEKLCYYEEYIIVNSEILDNLNKDYKTMFPKSDYYFNGIYFFLFMPDKGRNVVEIGEVNTEKIFKIEFLINSTKNKNYIINFLDKIKLDKGTLSSFFVFKKEDSQSEGQKNEFSYISPFFDEKQNEIGYAYKIVKDKNNFTNCYYNPLFINQVYLIRYFKFFEYNHIEPKKYYLIGEEWMNNYKDKNLYYKIKDTFENSKNLNLSMFINDPYKGKENLIKKLIYVFINEDEMDDIKKKFNENDNIMEDYPSEPVYEPLTDIFSNNQYFIYKNFFIFNEEIHNKIFNLNEQNSKEQKLKNNYCRCFFIDDYIFVILNRFLTQIDKFVVEVGKFDKEKKFEIYYIMISESEKDFNENMVNLKALGTKDYFKYLDFNQQNIVDLEAHNSYIYKYHQNSNMNMNINQEEFNPIINTSINEEKNVNYLKEVFNQPPSIGLQNVGATCYMNATIQCFGQLEKFVLYFKYNQMIQQVITKNKNNDCLTKSFKDLIENLWPDNPKYLDKKYIGKNSNNEYYKPIQFKKTISKMNPLFAGVQANDSKDLVNFIIMTLHDELNVGKKLDNNNNPDQTNQQEIYHFFMQNYYSEYQSIISQLFYGINGTVYLCNGCKTQKYNFQVGFFYIFPLEEVRKFKISNLYEQQKQNLLYQFNNNMINLNQMQILLESYNIQLQNNNSVSIVDCFDFNQKKEYMTGENAMYCNVCNKSENSMYFSYIVNSPEIMIIILNRGQGIQFKIKLEFTEFLDITNYVKFNNNRQVNYKLVGVVTHMGESGASGHFVAFCRSPINEHWYNYNDDLCFLIDNFEGQVIDYAMPYILFYQKV